uniref:RNA-dependent RNA polymerase n=1 Tax=Hulunbuir Botou tick virus 4 TaxID=2972063 RepID=A0A9E7V213_9VIRU|nr:MAG: RNA-dependent RNA polymerase [Hulunbuir Botou tick virus 4]
MPEARTREVKAGCAASRSLSKSLSRAARVILFEWFPNSKDNIPVHIQGETCDEVRKAWNEWTGERKAEWSTLRKTKSVGYESFIAAVKSCNRMFDRPCVPCDQTMFESVINDFAQNQTKTRNESWDFPPLFSNGPYSLLASEVRRIIGKGWGKRIDRSLRVPNQKGCFDLPTQKGGTLGARPWECQDIHPGNIRPVVAKTKGKARVVTLQNSYVKEILRPIHEGLYDHISEMDWLVRGELTEEHLQPLVDDLRDGEFHISGDYSQATNLINAKTVRTIVGVLCESDHLTPEEKRVLWQSFTDLRLIECTGTKYFVRGQMMGSYVSFPLLCILNRAMYNITQNWSHRLGGRKMSDRRPRPARFNGDDCAFNGTRGTFELWRQVTSFYGMEVNVDKTGLSKKKIELNSRVFFTRAGKLAPKPVLSFLDCTSDTLLLDAVQQSKGLHFNTRVWIINHLILNEIRIRDVSPEALPLGVFRRVVKKAWFRNACKSERTLSEKTFEYDSEQGKFIKTTKRGIQMVVGPSLPEEHYDWFNESYRDIQREYLENYRGRTVRIPSEPWYRRPKQKTGRKGKFGLAEMILRSKPSWAFVWPKSLLEYTCARESWRLSDPESNNPWKADHPFLTTRCIITHQVKPRFYPPVLEGEWFKEGDVWRWNGVASGAP